MRSIISWTGQGIAAQSQGDGTIRLTSKARGWGGEFCGPAALPKVGGCASALRRDAFRGQNFDTQLRLKIREHPMDLL